MAPFDDRQPGRVVRDASPPNPLFVATVLLFPCVLAAVCVGAGMLVERAGGFTLPGALLPALGTAALVVVTQLTTFVVPLAPASPWLLLAVGLAGFACARGRAAGLARVALQRKLSLAGPVLVYVLALAPVLIAGRPSFSSYMALSDSAVHIMGADYLVHHGQSFGHLDLRNSYGQFVNAYWGSGYPSGVDTLFGAGALLLRLPLIWAFQPFNAFLLACAFGPARVLAQRAGLNGAWSAGAALLAVLGALVYAYELIGSVKEVAALELLLCAGALLALQAQWIGRGPRAAIPLALVLAAGIGVLGIAFGVWGLAIAIVFAVALVGEVRSGRARRADALALVGVALGVGLLAVLPTLAHLSRSLSVAGNIASTGNPGNLGSPLHEIQMFGIWLNGSYKLEPTGSNLLIGSVLIGLAGALAVAGAVQLLRTRRLVLAGWLALSLVAWLIVSKSVTTWGSAKALMLTAPLIAVLVAAGIAAVRGREGRSPRAWLAGALAACLLAGALASDLMQYRSSNLAPTARYRELGEVGERFAGQGPALFTDFDEYSLYELRQLDVGGPDFVYPPTAVAAAAGGYGRHVNLDRLAPAALVGYPLIVTRRGPFAVRPPAAYRLAWRGAYYDVWRRARGGSGLTARVHRTLAGGAARPCPRLRALAARARAAQGGRGPDAARGPGARPGPAALAAAVAPRAVAVNLRASPHPKHWGHGRAGALVMNRTGTLRATVTLPAGGVWHLWIQGQLMPAVDLAVDGRRVASIAGQLGGNSLVPNTVPPLALRLAAGRHTLAITRYAPSFAPGDRGAAVLAAVAFTRAAGPGLAVVPVRDWHALCGRPLQWAELIAR